ncbi:hypothetical protein Rsub_06871 [Raphidocelis subcapitata]|uniref:Uncharacterized protein n=1 Tax=Raphidocelis subcapitata TaxID=307507 RepID=A0A2V0P4N3_9CHLO|nr:hypothetical protein Rsub_06871 [Raphidocelis subcapitata]|eukprot:GBF93872.1 hypothetical protein Rsub_06871 [Raphidocelis subcapitata]
MAASPWAVEAHIDSSAARITATAEGLLYLTPEDAYQVLTLAEGAPIFRVRDRTAVECGAEPGVLRERVTFVAPMRVLFWKAWARTTVAQRADLSRAGERVAVRFDLLHSDLMSRLEGEWSFELLRPAARPRGPSSPLDEGCWPLTRVRYTFSMWPKGVPTALRRIPGLMDAVRGTVGRESTALLDKLAFVASKVSHPGGCVRTALRLACCEVERAGSYKRLATRSGSAPAPAPLVAPACGRMVSAHRLSFVSSATSSADHAAALAGLAEAVGASAAGAGPGTAAAAAAAAAAATSAAAAGTAAVRFSRGSHSSSGDDDDFASCSSGSCCELDDLGDLDLDLEVNISNAGSGSGSGISGNTSADASASDVGSGRGSDADGGDQTRAARARARAHRKPAASRLGREAAAAKAGAAAEGLDVPPRRSRAAAIVRAWACMAP